MSKRVAARLWYCPPRLTTGKSLTERLLLTKIKHIDRVPLPTRRRERTAAVLDSHGNKYLFVRYTEAKIKSSSPRRWRVRAPHAKNFPAFSELELVDLGESDTAVLFRTLRQTKLAVFVPMLTPGDLLSK